MMKMIKKLNVLFISFVVGIIYVLIIGFAWLLHITTKQKSQETASYWHTPKNGKLNKQYFSSPY